MLGRERGHSGFIVCHRQEEWDGVGQHIRLIGWHDARVVVLH